MLEQLVTLLLLPMYWVLFKLYREVGEMKVTLNNLCKKVNVK